MKHRLQNRLRREHRIKLFTVIGILALSLIVILAVENMLLSFVLAFVVTYLLSPVVNNLERRGLPRTLAIFLPFLAISVVMGIAVFLSLPMVTVQFADLRLEIPKYIDGTSTLLQDLQRHFHGLLPMTKMDLGKTVENRLFEYTQTFFDGLPRYVSKAVTTLLLAPFFAFFMLQDGRNLSRNLISMVPNNLFELALNLQHQINKQMGEFIRARLLEAAIVGAVVWLGLYIIDFPYASFLALFALVTNLIPYIGPIIGAVPAVVIALINQGSGVDLLVLTSVYFVAQLIDVVFIIPLVVAKIVDLHPVTVVIVIIIGAQLMGVLGMMISIPVASVMKLVFHAAYHHIVDFRASS